LVAAAGAVGGYLLSRVLGNNNNGKSDNSTELTLIANKLDHTKGYSTDYYALMLV